MIPYFVPVTDDNLDLFLTNVSFTFTKYCELYCEFQPQYQTHNCLFQKYHFSSKGLSTNQYYLLFCCTYYNNPETLLLATLFRLPWLWWATRCPDQMHGAGQLWRPTKQLIRRWQSLNFVCPIFLLTALLSTSSRVTRWQCSAKCRSSFIIILLVTL